MKDRTPLVRHLLRNGLYIDKNNLFTILTVSPGEAKSGGHVTITHRMLVSIILVFFFIILPRSDKRWLETLGKIFLAYYRIS